MAWPTVAVVTTNMDANSDSPLSARSDILDLTTKFNDLIAMRGVANGVASLDASGRIPAAQNTLYRGAFAYRTASQAIPTGTNTQIIFTSEDHDTNNLYSVANGEMTVPSGVTRAKIALHVAFDATTSTTIQLFTRKNGSGGYPGSYYEAFFANSSYATSFSFCSPVLSVAAGDVFTVWCVHNKGSDLNVLSSGNYSTWFSMFLVE